MGYIWAVVEVRQTAVFRAWATGLKDPTVRAIIADRIERVANGALGDIKSLGQGLSELRINHGPGFRVYIVQRGQVLIILLCGGDKSSQARDIRRARTMAKEV